VHSSHPTSRHPALISQPSADDPAGLSSKAVLVMSRSRRAVEVTVSVSLVFVALFAAMIRFAPMAIAQRPSDPMGGPAVPKRNLDQVPFAAAGSSLVLYLLAIGGLVLVCIATIGLARRGRRGLSAAHPSTEAGTP